MSVLQLQNPVNPRNLTPQLLLPGGLDESVNESILHAAFIPFGDIKVMGTGCMAVPSERTTCHHRLRTCVCALPACLCTNNSTHMHRPRQTNPGAFHCDGLSYSCSRCLRVSVCARACLVCHSNVMKTIDTTAHELPSEHLTFRLPYHLCPSFGKNLK